MLWALPGDTHNCLATSAGERRRKNAEMKEEKETTKNLTPVVQGHAGDRREKERKLEESTTHMSLTTNTTTTDYRLTINGATFLAAAAVRRSEKNSRRDASLD